jgi:hypothetical protein
VEQGQRAEQSNSDRATRCAEEEGGDGLLFPSDDEVGALQGGIRAERVQRAEQSTEPWANVGPRIASKSGEMIGVMRTAR